MASFEAAEEEESMEEQVDVKTSAIKRLTPGTGPPSGSNMLRPALRAKPAVKDDGDNTADVDEYSDTGSEAEVPGPKSKRETKKAKTAKPDEPGGGRRVPQS